MGGCLGKDVHDKVIALLFLYSEGYEKDMLDTDPEAPQPDMRFIIHRVAEIYVFFAAEGIIATYQPGGGLSVNPLPVDTSLKDHVLSSVVEHGLPPTRTWLCERKINFQLRSAMEQILKEADDVRLSLDDKLYSIIENITDIFVVRSVSRFLAWYQDQAQAPDDTPPSLPTELPADNHIIPNPPLNNDGTYDGNINDGNNIAAVIPLARLQDGDDADVPLVLLPEPSSESGSLSMVVQGVDLPQQSGGRLFGISRSRKLPEQRQDVNPAIPLGQSSSGPPRPSGLFKRMANQLKRSDTSARDDNHNIPSDAGKTDVPMAMLIVQDEHRTRERERKRKTPENTSSRQKSLFISMRNMWPRMEKNKEGANANQGAKKHWTAVSPVNDIRPFLQTFFDHVSKQHSRMLNSIVEVEAAAEETNTKMI